jgi:hypothetical protein
MSEWSRPSWQEWLSGLETEEQHRAEALRDTFARRGADDPEGWARSEVNEDIAQLTRYLFLRATWRRMEWAVREALSSESARRLMASGCDLATMESVVKAAVLDVSFNVCFLLDSPDGTSWPEGGTHRSDIEPHDRRWRLMEVAPDGSLTGRDVGGLHESLRDTDPTLNDAREWFA